MHLFQCKFSIWNSTTLCTEGMCPIVIEKLILLPEQGWWLDGESNGLAHVSMQLTVWEVWLYSLDVEQITVDFIARVNKN